MRVKSRSEYTRTITVAVCIMQLRFLSFFYVYTFSTLFLMSIIDLSSKYIFQKNKQNIP